MTTSSSSPRVFARMRNLERIRQVSEVAIRHGFGYFFERHNLWEALKIRRRVRADRVIGPRGRHIREMLEELGPTYVKFGQLLSTRPDLVPPDVITELVFLQDRVPSFPAAEARSLIEKELGLTVERLFVSFSDEPIAAASIGQVHEAVLPDGREVMVKVRRPRVREQIDLDLDLFKQIAGLLQAHFGERLFVDPVSLVEEFARSITGELDYVLEGRNAEKFAHLFRDDDSVVIPKVYWSYTTSKVLTLDRLNGPTLASIDKESLNLSERRVLAETLARTWFKQILEKGFVHGDPHPANIVVINSQCIGMLDFGIVSSLSEEDLEQGVGLFLAMMQRDLEGVKRRLKKLGVSWERGKEEDITRALENVFGRYYGARLSEVDPGIVLREIFQIIYSLHLRLPSRFLVMDKAILTAEGVVANLYPDFNFFEIARPYARRLVRQRYEPGAVLNRMERSVSAYGEIFRDYPFQLHDLLEELKSGDLEINFIHRGLERLTHKLDVVTNRMVVGIVVAALGLASSLLAAFVQSGPRVLGVSVWGIPGFVAALVFGSWLIWGIVRSGRL